MVVVRIFLLSRLMLASLLLRSRIGSCFLLRMSCCSSVIIFVGVIDHCMSVVDVFGLAKAWSVASPWRRETATRTVHVEKTLLNFIYQSVSCTPCF